MKKTKIICTLGPASTNEKTIKELLLNGLVKISNNIKYVSKKYEASMGSALKAKEV